MTPEQIDLIVEKSVDRTLQKFGVDTQDAAATRADFIHLRRWRLAVEASVSRVATTVAGIVTTGILGAVYLVFFNGKH